MLRNTAALREQLESLSPDSRLWKALRMDPHG